MGYTQQVLPLIMRPYPSTKMDAMYKRIQKRAKLQEDLATNYESDGDYKSAAECRRRAQDIRKALLAITTNKSVI